MVKKGGVLSELTKFPPIIKKKILKGVSSGEESCVTFLFMVWLVASSTETQSFH